MPTGAVCVILVTICFCSCSEANLGLSDFRVTSITYALCKNSCNLPFVTILCRWKCLYVIDEFNHLCVVDDTNPA